MQSETLGRFGHHPEADIDYNCEIDELVAMAYDRITGMREQPDLEDRVRKAMEFRVLETPLELRWLNHRFNGAREIYMKVPDCIERLMARATPTPPADSAGLVERLRAVDISWSETGELCAEAAHHITAQDAEVARLRKLVNTPVTDEFANGVNMEALHQRERWGSEHDAGKTPEDWFWLIGYLAQKALRAQNDGDLGKAMHHTVSTGAALANWHLALTGVDTSMRPGIEQPKGTDHGQ